MNFFLDENFPKSAERLLIAGGHDVLDIRGTNKEGSDDLSIFNMAQAQRAIFLSTDKDFFHTIPYLFPDHYGIVVIALRQPNRHGILSRLSWFLEHYGNLSINGKAFLLRDQAFVKYPAED